MSGCGAALLQALAEATGRSVKEIQKQYDQEGDLGTVAAAARGKQKPMFKPPPLTVSGVGCRHRVLAPFAYWLVGICTPTDSLQLFKHGAHRGGSYFRCTPLRS
jgi:DNA ligase N terminus